MTKNLVQLLKLIINIVKNLIKVIYQHNQKNIAILTCMDARFDPAKALGLEEGDAHVIRNAGGRATDDAIRSLVVSHKLLGTVEWFLIQHTDCGMQKISDETIAKLLEDDLETASFDGKSWSNNNNAKSENSNLAQRRL